MTKNAMLFLIILIVVCASCQPTEIQPQISAPVPKTLTTNTIQPVTLTSTPSLSKVRGKNTAGVLAFYSNRDGNPEIYSMKADGSGLREFSRKNQRNDPLGQAFDVIRLGVQDGDPVD